MHRSPAALAFLIQRTRRRRAILLLVKIGAQLEGMHFASDEDVTNNLEVSP
jgi:hypothetical protein